MDTKCLGGPWFRTIFAQFEDEGLKEALEECARELDCSIWYGEPSSPDIIAVPYFISIIDPNLVGAEAWDWYLEYLKETDDDTPCIIIDKSKNFELADIKKLKGEKVFCFDLNDELSSSQIIAIIKEIKSTLRAENLKETQNEGG